jgi:hypothetical protein
VFDLAMIGLALIWAAIFVGMLWLYQRLAK